MPYVNWVRQGKIIATEGAVIDYDVIRAKVIEVAEQHHIKEMAIDRWNATLLATQLSGDGFRNDRIRTRLCVNERTDKRTVAARNCERSKSGRQPGLALDGVERIDKAGPGRQHEAGQVKEYGADYGIVATLMALGRVMESDDKCGSA